MAPYSSIFLPDITRNLRNIIKNPPKPPSNLELSLNLAAAGKLTPSAVQSVLLQTPSSATERSTLLRFFIWAGLHLHHSVIIYGSAAKSLDLPRFPETISVLLESYQKEKYPLSARAFRILFELCRHGGSAHQAVDLLRRMPMFKCFPDTSSYNCALRLLLREGGTDEARVLLKEMESSGVLPNMTTCLLMVKVLCCSGEAREAREFLLEMKRFGCEPNVVIFSALIHGACEAGDIELALEVLREMEAGPAGGPHWPNVVTYTCLMKCLCEKGMMDEALGMYDRMSMHGCGANRVVLATLLMGLCKKKMVGEAFALVEKVNGGEEGYSSLVLSLIKVGDVAEADRLMEAMLERGVNPDGAARNELLREIIARGDIDRGLRWVEDIYSAELTLDPEVYTSLLELAVREKKLSEAVGLGEWMLRREIPLKVNSSLVMEALAEVFEKCGRVDLAQRIILVE